MKKRDLMSLYNGLCMLEGRPFTVKFSYFVAKNKVLLKNEFAALDAVRKPSESYIAYDTRRAELALKMADKDENGNAKIENNNFVIVEKVDEFKERLDKLKKQYAKAIKDHEKKTADFEEILDEEFEYSGPKIDLKDIPQSVEPSILEAFITADLIIENT